VSAERICQRWGGPGDGTKYCTPCSPLVARERGMHSGRRKPCPGCGGVKEPGKRRYCVACWEKRQPLVKIAERDRGRFKSRREREARGVVPRAPKVDAEGNVRCSTCLEYLPPSQFRKVKRGARGESYGSQCRSCYSTYLHEHRLGRCAICMHRPRTRRLAVDHSHDSGEIRGLLCSRCNRDVLGCANESPALLRRAARYLETPPAKTGDPIESLGEAEDQGWRAFVEVAERLRPGEVHSHQGLFALSLDTFRALTQAAGWAMVIEGKEMLPNPQLAIDDMALLETTWQNSVPLLTAAGYIAEPATHPTPGAVVRVTEES
jgi:hypothetical protein